MNNSFLSMASIVDFDPLNPSVPATKVEITVSCRGIPGKKCGTIIVKAEELNNCRESVMMQFCGNKLDKKDFFGKSDPFLVFYRSNEDGTFTICHKTEVVKNTLNPVWQAFKIPVRALCNGDYDRYVSFFRQQLLWRVKYNVVNPKKKGKKKKYLNSGTVTLLSFLVDTENGNPQNPYCAGIDGVMEAYYQSLKSVQLYGPTNFSPVINHVARYAASVKDGSQYFVLLIITDGVISDMAQTKESIVNVRALVLSLIFTAMVELDGDEVRISSRGRFAERDIVQFVPFRDYIDRTGNHILSMARLAKDVLAEIPDQFLSYMRTRGIKPSPAPPPYTPPGQPIQTQI
uniref:Copine 8 n=1 Tax=Neolamprologus brichardi TaxID=32507 RepID=A0A3Q4N8R0_NEOBR